MGCSSSKHFEKESLMERWMSSPQAAAAAGFLSMDDHPLQCYHHFVALTTARSYGILRILSPEAEIGPQKKKKRSSAGDSLSELYENLRSLESAVATATPPPPQNALSSSSPRDFDYEDAKRVLRLEIINVDEMMKGLEESEAEQDCVSLQQQQQQQEVKGSPSIITSAQIRNGGDNSSIEKERNSPPESRSSANCRRPYSRFSQTAAECTGSGRMKATTEIDEKDMVKAGNNKRKCVATTLFIPSSMAAAAMSKRMAVGSGGVPSPGPHSPFFDPDLIASYEAKLADLSEDKWAELESPMDDNDSSQRGFEWKCPPGGEEKLVIYTTTLGGIRKTFEDCNAVREILRGYGVSIDERDVSMHLEFLRELRELSVDGGMGRRRRRRMAVVCVPRVFVKGVYVGSREEVTKLHDDGKLRELLEGVEMVKEGGGKCDGCDGVRFVPCLECRGSCKLRQEEEEEGGGGGGGDGEQQQQQGGGGGDNHHHHRRRHITFVRCPHCNENGLIQCPICT